MRRCAGFSLLVVLAALSRAGRLEAGAPGATRDIRTHDPSTIVRDGGTYWVFHTGRGCKSEFSTDLKNWKEGPLVFPQPLAWWKDAAPGTNFDVWAPDAIKIGARYFLYYSVSVFGKRTSVIGLAVNETLDPRAANYAWKDMGPVIQTSEKDNFNAIDPAICFDEAGKLWLIFGSYWSGIKAVELDPKTGTRVAADSPLHSLAAAKAPSTAIEASYVYRHGEFFYLFVNWGQCCKGVNSTYVVGVGRSRAITGPYTDRDGNDMLKGGGTVFLKTSGRFIGPGHVGILRDGDAERCSYHFYDAEENGRPKLKVDKLAWGAEGWPQLKESSQ